MITNILIMMALAFAHQGDDKATVAKFPDKEVKLLVQQSMDYWRIPGVAIAIVHQGRQFLNLALVL